ncbi:MAG: hypothetical protein [Bacilladnavirus sp.]|nr:MAG: hypothetical protein [Bacilladnavirus sp.]
MPVISWQRLREVEDELEKEKLAIQRLKYACDKWRCLAQKAEANREGTCKWYGRRSSKYSRRVKYYRAIRRAMERREWQSYANYA